MRRKHHLLIVLALLPLFVCAAEGEAGAHSALVDFLGKCLNFALLFGGLAFVLARPLRAYLSARGESVRQALAEAASSREEAERKVESIRSRLAGLGEEARQIREAGEALGRREKTRITEFAAREADKVRAMAREEIEARAQAARRELRAYAAELAVSLARSRIERRLTPEIQSRLIDESIDVLGKQNAE